MVSIATTIKLVTEIALNHKQKRLINGRLMVCPRCKKEHDILQYLRLKLIEEFARETTPVYKCPSCKWIFAPADDLVLVLLGEREIS